MKTKLTILAALCAVTFCANAQTEKGKKIISGSIGYTSNTTTNANQNINSFSNEEDKTKIFNIMPSFGYFVGKNLAIGIGVGYVNGKSVVNSSSYSYPATYLISQESKQKIYTFGPFMRYYVDVAEKFKFFGLVTTQIGFGKIDLTSAYSGFNGYGYTLNTSEVSYKTTTYNASINPGFAFFPAKKWAIEFSFPLLGYSKIKPKEQQNTVYPTSESFNFATDSFNPSIGFNFHF